ncbi:3'-5' exonuclease [Methylobacterium nodulans]|uniref:Predicted 3'-5' exonuclease PolB-like domain-containing protein n=1 Tax=Methylobacterium nodulans (strain LMG 21967 / CNCM I-2342 / ORS 2060) TaxID=460265 RepID=B8IPP4_METNO|nr:3'-5' exonuclease [Methylobacterium nodulans]ACL62336.1 conserved hypothetical protein [Methylobacterium nodulans ORS 2060]
MTYFDNATTHGHLVSFDIETVPDRELIPNHPKDKFPPQPITHRVVAISLVEAKIVRRADRTERYIVNCCRTGGRADWDEKRLLAGFWQYFANSHARVVTWNGKGFDLPVLRSRAMIHGISAAPWFTSGTRWESYTQRYSPDWHCDLMEQLSDYRSCASMSMEDVAVALGLPGKVGGHGSLVEEMIEQGGTDQVRAYCESDTLNLFAVYARWALLTGRTDADGYNASIESLVRCLEAERETRPHFGEFLDRWRSADRPMPMFLPAVEVISEMGPVITSGAVV